MWSIRFFHLVAAIATILAISSPIDALRVEMKRSVAKRWCIAYPLADHGKLQTDIDSLCSVVDCSSIQPGGSCYEPNNIVDHASVVFNLYYKAHGSQPSACNFGGDSMFSLSDPSSGSCVYP